jgi:heterodisulfide reductase subunit B
MQFDNSEHPQVMEKFVRAMVTEFISYSFQSRCCGASLTMNNLEAAYKIGHARLEELEQKDTEVVITACGNCHLLLDRKQSAYYSCRRLPCLFLPQLLGLAMGFTPEQLMIDDSCIRSLVNSV